MATSNEIALNAHPNIYNGSMGRQLTIHYSIPSQGTNEETGFVVFVPGFGGGATSNVYKKMRDVFADQYNLVAIQPNYFGSQFMQQPESLKLDDDSRFDVIRKIGIKKFSKLEQLPEQLLFELKASPLILRGEGVMNETQEEFNDMGLMQAVDIIQSVEIMQEILKQNDLDFNGNKVIGYGHSHGGFLLHLANRIHSTLFSHIIDNSGWLVPGYLFHDRYLYQRVGKAQLEMRIPYLAKQDESFKQLLDLKNIYSYESNTCEIYALQGTNDHLVNHKEKEKLFSTHSNIQYLEIDESNVDGEMIKSNTHGLDADFLKLFDYYYPQFGMTKSRELNVREKTKLGRYSLERVLNQGISSFNLVNH